MSKPKMNLQDLVPDNCKEVIVKTKQDLLLLGQENLEAFRSYHQEISQTYGTQIKELQKLGVKRKPESMIDYWNKRPTSHEEVLQLRASLYGPPASGYDPPCEDDYSGLIRASRRHYNAKIEARIQEIAQLRAERRVVSAKIGYLTRLIKEIESLQDF